MSDEDATNEDQRPDESSAAADSPADAIPDSRLYVPDHQEWDVRVKRNSDRQFCFSKHPGEDWFHLLLDGEIYIAGLHEMYCLRCALRMGIVTTDRLFWQHRVPKARKLGP